MFGKASHNLYRNKQRTEVAIVQCKKTWKNKNKDTKQSQKNQSKTQMTGSHSKLATKTIEITKKKNQRMKKRRKKKLKNS